MTKRRLRKLSGQTDGTHLSYQITLPKQLVESLNWQFKQAIEITMDGNSLVLKAIS